MYMYMQSKGLRPKVLNVHLKNKLYEQFIKLMPHMAVKKVTEE
jgi:hypothetical protein